MQTRLSDEQVIKNQELVFKLIEKNIPEPRLSLVRNMLKGPVGDEYFTAPASSREEYHFCFPGGLAAHSLNVVRNLRKLADALSPGKYDVGTLLFVGLFHDLGKAGDGVKPAYVPKDSDWHRKQGMLYEINKNCLGMPNSERGLYILQNQGITVSSDEYMAIRLNDGQYALENGPYKMKEPELALLVHWADRWSCEEEKSGV